MEVDYMKINNQKLVNRWNNLMNDICLEYLAIGTKLSELETNRKYYGTEEGITVAWMLKEAEYWLSCYYETGHCRCDDRFEGKRQKQKQRKSIARVDKFTHQKTEKSFTEYLVVMTMEALYQWSSYFTEAQTETKAFM